MAKKRTHVGWWILVVLVIVGLISGAYYGQQNSSSSSSIKLSTQQLLQNTKIPQYSGKASVIVNNNTPSFTDSELVTKSYQKFSDLDKLGRCGAAEACLSQDIMPTAERGDISEVHPSGWQAGTNGIYNRGHLLGYQLTGQNANEKNLVTMTRQCNVEAMLPYENEIADYLRSSSNHVMYRVTPIFKDNELVCRGVLMEAKSVEDNGKGVKFCIYCYNNQDGYTIDYSTGRLYKEGSTQAIGHPYTSSGKRATYTYQVTSSSQSAQSNHTQTYILNTRSHVFHKVSCDAVAKMSSKNKQQVKASRQSLVNQGYTPCPRCNP